MSLVAPRHEATLSSTFSSKTTGCPGKTIDEMFALELVNFLRSLFSQQCRRTKDGSALTSCATSPLQLTCRLNVYSLSHSFWTWRTDDVHMTSTFSLWQPQFTSRLN